MERQNVAGRGSATFEAFYRVNYFGEIECEYLLTVPFQNFIATTCNYQEFKTWIINFQKNQSSMFFTNMKRPVV